MIANRTLARAEQLVEDLKTAVPDTKLHAISLDQLTGEFDIVINATSASLTGEALQLPKHLFSSRLRNGIRKTIKFP